MARLYAELALHMRIPMAQLEAEDDETVATWLELIDERADHGR